MIDCVPAGSAVVVKVATPLPFNCAVPRAVVPSRKVMVPVGAVFPDCGATVAVKVTLWPDVICVTEGESDVVVAVVPAVTITLTVDEMEPKSLPSPP